MAYLPTTTELLDWKAFLVIYAAIVVVAGGYAACLNIMANRVSDKWHIAERRRLDALMGRERRA